MLQVYCKGLRQVSKGTNLLAYYVIVDFLLVLNKKSHDCLTSVFVLLLI